MIVADNSAVIAYLAAPKNAPKLGALIDEGETIAAPDLIDLEFLNALRRLELAKAVSEADALIALLDFKRMPLTRFPVAHLMDGIWELRHNFTAYDASYVVLAMRLGIPLATRDGKMARATAGLVELIAI